MLSLLATPSPVPIVINMPASGSPWWGVPAITATAVLFGALVAFFSTRFSDQRKRKADDRRQWDKEIRDLYLEATACCDDIRKSRWEGSSGGVTPSYERARGAANKLKTVSDSLELIAEPKTVQAARKLEEVAENFANSLHDGIVDKALHRMITPARSELLEAVKVNLRTKTRKSPFWLFPRKE